MRKNSSYIFSAFALIATLLLSNSCIKEPFNRDNNSDKIVLYAGMRNATLDTKADYTGGVIEADSPFEIPVGIFRTDQTSNVRYPAFVDGNATSNAVIPAKLLSPDQSNTREVLFEYAQYGDGVSEISFAGVGPWSDNVTTEYGDAGTRVTFDIDGQTDVIYGSPVRGTKTENFPCMQFSHALCQFNIYAYYAYGERQKIDENGMPVYENGEPVMEAYSTYEDWGELETATLKDIISKCIVGLPNSLLAPESFTIEYTGATQDVTMLNRTPGNGIELGKTFDEATLVKQFIAAPPSGDNAFINISVKTAKEQSTKDVSVAKNFKAGSAYNIYLRFADHGQINASATYAEWVPGIDVEQSQGVSMYYSLSRYGTANSYMISSGNYNYSFDAMVKGNGLVSSLTPDASGKPTSVELNTDHVKILWTDFDNTVDGNPYVFVQEQIANGLVLVKVGDSSQNNHELQKEGNVLIGAYDADNNLIWTWHLWLSDPVTTVGLGNGYNIQDRNLGATSKDNSQRDAGLFYQWGRFTPFSFNQHWKNDATASTSATEFTDTVSTAGVTYAEAIGHPGTIYGEGAQSWMSNANESKGTIWGYKNEYTEMEKTIYDPCPPGYMMTDANAWNAIVSNAPIDRDGGINLKILGNELWLPSTGYYTGTSNNTTGFYTWTAESGSNKGKYFNYPLSGTPGLALADQNTVLKPVRCKAVAKEDVFVRDLSAAQTANSYIVSKTGYYKFKANVKGNGNGTLQPLGGTGIWDLTAGTGVDLYTEGATIQMLWWQGDLTDNSWQNATSFDAANFTGVELMDGGKLDENGFATFKVSSIKKGNLILAVVRNGTILWSWHIWILDSNPKNVRNGSYVMMDRNLGATSVPVLDDKVSTISGADLWSTFGFFYQWGRKDPIPGAPIGTTTNNTKSSTWWHYNNGNWTKKTAIETAAATTIDKITQDPVKFYLGQGNNQIRWCTSFNNNNLLGAGLLGYAVASTNSGKAFSKTVYDPCPPGYKMPAHYVKYNFVGEGNTHAQVYTTSEYSTDTKQNGYAYPDTDETYGQVWWPFTGKRDSSGNLQEVTTTGRLLTFMPMGSTGNNRSLYVDSTSETIAHGYSWNRTYTYKYTYYFGEDDGQVTSDAMAVRCLKE